MFKGLSFSKLKTDITDSHSEHKNSIDKNIKESYTSRANNCKILKNYQPILGLDCSEVSHIKAKYSNKSTKNTTKDSIRITSLNHSKPSVNPLYIADQLNQKLKKFTKLSDLSTTSINKSKHNLITNFD